MEAVDTSTAVEELATAGLPAPTGRGAEPPAAEPLPADRFLDRELSWLAFNNRVLDLAKDRQRVPLLERAKFLAIFASNLDEFFMVRVAGLKRRIAAGVAVPHGQRADAPRGALGDPRAGPGSWSPSTPGCSRRRSGPSWPREGIEILRWDELTADEKDRMHDLFAERIFPVLTPLAVDPSHPFPYISGLSINLAVLVRNPETGDRQFARVKVPTRAAPVRRSWPRAGSSPWRT